MSRVRATLRKLDRIELEIYHHGMGSGHVSMTQIEAERLLYDLHGICETLRGVNKPLRWQDRFRKLWLALSGV